MPLAPREKQNIYCPLFAVSFSSLNAKNVKKYQLHGTQLS
jgi:hypothetical protein